MRWLRQGASVSVPPVSVRGPAFRTDPTQTPKPTSRPRVSAAPPTQRPRHAEPRLREIEEERR